MTPQITLPCCFPPVVWQILSLHGLAENPWPAARLSPAQPKLIYCFYAFHQIVITTEFFTWTTQNHFFYNALIVLHIQGDINVHLHVSDNSEDDVIHFECPGCQRW